MGHLRHSLFFVHLAIEKILKAHIVKKTRDLPPRIHNLIRLAGAAEIPLDLEQEKFVREFGIYQIEGRYPESEQVSFCLPLTQL